MQLSTDSVFIIGITGLSMIVLLVLWANLMQKQTALIQQQRAEIKRYRQALTIIARDSSCDDTWDFANRVLDEIDTSPLPYRMGERDAE